MSAHPKDPSTSPTRVEMSPNTGSVVPLSNVERRRLLLSIDKQISAIERRKDSQRRVS